jgi:mRNA interferase MazF
VTCAPITRTIRGIRSEVEVGVEEGLPETSVISCDNVLTLPQHLLDSAAVGRVSHAKRVDLDRALRYSLGIEY